MKCVICRNNVMIYGNVCSKTCLQYKDWFDSNNYYKIYGWRKIKYIKFGESWFREYGTYSGYPVLERNGWKSCHNNKNYYFERLRISGSRNGLGY